MAIVPRRLFMWGGAVAVAASGFAYMASNSVASSNAGEGSQQVSGYTVSNISYSGVPTKGNHDGLAGTMQYYAAPQPTDNHGISEQDGVSTVQFTLSPDNAHWAAVQLYDASKNVIGGGGASNCKEAAGVWTCNVTNDPGTGPVNTENIRWIDVEAAQ